MAVPTRYNHCLYRCNLESSKVPQTRQFVTDTLYGSSKALHLLRYLRSESSKALTYTSCPPEPSWREYIQLVLQFRTMFSAMLAKREADAAAKAAAAAEAANAASSEAAANKLAKELESKQKQLATIDKMKAKAEADLASLMHSQQDVLEKQYA